MHSAADLILNQDGSVYHLNLVPSDLANQIILVGDPDRVPIVSQFFDRVLIKKQKREFVTHTGILNDTPISVISTGIGVGNIDIVFNEIDALVNIDLCSRQNKAKRRAVNIIRIGTAGSMQSDIALDSLVMTKSAIGFDGNMGFYFSPSKQDGLGHDFSSSLPQSAQHLRPYSANASAKLLQHFAGLTTQCGITATMPGFYAAQGRHLYPTPPLIEDWLSILKNYTYQGSKILNLEMETAAIYALGEFFGHHCLSISSICAQRHEERFSSQPAQAISHCIAQTLRFVSTLEAAQPDLR
jgi:uridine phosphorylase